MKDLRDVIAVGPVHGPARLVITAFAGPAIPHGSGAEEWRANRK